MRLRLPKIPLRLSVRGMMVVVAIVGLVIGLGVEGARRRDRYLQLARQHAIIREDLHRFLVIVPPTDSVQFFGDRRAIAERIGYHGRLKMKYEQAARFPWFPIEPDPPEPE